MTSNTFQDSRYQSSISKRSLMPIYGSDRNAPYQIDFQVRNRGKRVAATKRCVKWRFGFPNSDALARGACGADCRGSEHDVALVWSVASGKRLVLVDGVDVHFSVGRNKSKIECSWIMSGQHVFKLIAHAALPLRPTPGFRQFDLLLDGRSFFDFPQIFELGGKPVPRLAPSSTAPPPNREHQGWDPSTRDDCETTQSCTVAGIDDPTDGMSDQQSFLTDPLPTPDLVSDPSPTNQAQDLISTPLPVALLDQASSEVPSATVPSSELTAPWANDVAHSYDASVAFTGSLTPVGPSAAYSGAAVTNDNSFGPVGVAFTGPLTPVAPSAAYSGAAVTNVTSFGPVGASPSYEPWHQSLSQSMGTMPGTSPGGTAPSGTHGPLPSTETPTIPQMVQTIATPMDVVPASCNDSVAGSLWTNSDAGSHSADVGSHSNGDQVATGASRQTMTVDTTFPQDRDESPRTVGDIDQALRGLVNLEDITASMEDQKSYHKLTMSPSVPASATNQTTFASQPLPPTTPTWAMGAGASLAQMKGATEQIKASKTPVQVMNPSPYSTSGGALVTYGNHGMGGPPPLQQMRGFGVGASMDNGGYTQSRQDLPLPYAPQQW